MPRATPAAAAMAKHMLWPARVTLNGARATSETNVAILVRQTIEGVATDLTSYGRFLDRHRAARRRLADGRARHAL